MTESLQEEHGNPIFGVKFNELLDEEGTFATVGSNRVLFLLSVLALNHAIIIVSINHIYLRHTLTGLGHGVNKPVPRNFYCTKCQPFQQNCGSFLAI